jgi:Uma2 family endonuclease
MSTTAAPMTIEEFLRLPRVEGEKMELIHGELVSMAYAGFMHERVKSNLNRILVVWLDQHLFGQVFAETTYRMPDGGDALCARLECAAQRTPYAGQQGFAAGRAGPCH